MDDWGRQASAEWWYLIRNRLQTVILFSPRLAACDFTDFMGRIKALIVSFTSNKSGQEALT